MVRALTVIPELQQLSELSEKPLDLCSTCLGCEVMNKMKEMRKEAWEKGRQSIKMLVMGCNKYRAANNG